MTKTIVVDGHNITLKQGTGIATYARNLVSGLIDNGNQVHLLASVLFKPSESLPDLNEVRFAEGHDSERLNPALWWWYDGRDVLRSLRRQQATRVAMRGLSLLPSGQLPEGCVVHIAQRAIERSTRRFFWLDQMLDMHLDTKVDAFHASFPVPLRFPSVPNLYTIHDLIPLRLPRTALGDKRYMYRILKRLAETADHVVTVSEYSKRDIIEAFGIPPDRVTNTYQAVAIPERVLARTPDQIAQDVRDFFGLDFREYLLFFGALEPKKNVSALIDAFVGSRVQRDLVIVGASGWSNHEELKKIGDNKFEFFRFDGSLLERHRRIKHIEYLRRDLLYTLIQGARAVVFPSLYEGFGLPVLESMLLGTPVVTSNNTSLPEIAGDAALLVDPYDVRSIAGGIRTIDGDDDLRAHLVERGRVQSAKFSPVAYRERLRELYARVL